MGLIEGNGMELKTPYYVIHKEELDSNFKKLKDAIGVGKFEAELVLLDPKQKPNEENDVKIKRFCEKL